MGHYNPHAPHILGQEWVPIRNAPYVPDGVVERGYTFRIDAVTTPVSGAFYVEQIAENRLANSCDLISVYPAGQESLTGPVKSVRIPASAISVNNPGSIDTSEGLNALLNPEDTEFIIFTADTGISSQLRVNFDTSPYAQILLGKRILDVRIRYQLSSFNIANADNFSIDVEDTASSTITFPQITEITSTADISKVSVLSITEMDPFWDSTAAARGQRTILPWRFQELNRFRSGASPLLVVSIQNNAVLFDVFLGFMDLEVLYCEETRVLYGGFKTYDTTIANTPALPIEFYNVGAIATRLYNPITHTQGATLPPGDYVVTIYHRDMSSRSIYQGAPRIRALREYYQLPHQRGRLVRQTLTLDDEFTADETDVLTQVTLHTATQIVTGVHPYGTQYGAPIYGSRTAIQEIEDNPSSGTGVPYPQVRFYARRYGNTTTPLTLVDVAAGTSTVSISVTDFDALPEIVDGWREVTLRFATPPTFPVTADDVDWRWQSTGELTGNQWQIMVADGPSGSWGPVPAAAATGPATYWAPLGSQVALNWQSPTISGTAQDTTSDAVLIFSQDPPAVTGFAITQLSQAITGIAEPLCEGGRCVPTAITYNRLTWNALGYCDTFDTDQVDGWPNADTGQAYALSGGVVPGNYDVNGGSGKHTMTTTAVARNSTITVAAPLSLTNARVDIAVSAIATGGSIIAGVGVGTDFDNMYAARLQFQAAGVLVLEIRKTFGGAQASLGTVTIGGYVPDQAWTAEISWRIGGFLEARAWPVGGTRPHYAQKTAIDSVGSVITTFTAVVLRSVLEAGVTNVNPVVSYDSASSTTDQINGGSTELQRRDSLTDWQTIMLSTSPGCAVAYSDFEARVGMSSEYRIRTLNALDFEGPWVTGSGTIPAPGVTVAGRANSILIFTTNEQPESSLAYVMQWEGQPVEQFAFPEADTVSLQRMFGRDYFLAIRPLERGGERFSRNILINNAAIPVPSLANFHDLRDLAWTDVNYICVRDELGNRWFATVIVPDGEIRRDRTIYLARIDVTQVTNTATPVD